MMSKSRFRLSRANYIFLTLVVIGYSVLHFLTSGNSDEEMQFSDVLIEENFYELLDNIQTNENNINQLSEQLINTL